jgi:2-polyprenyl-3-methyl-5-hydroxy-6-metoxy-1,4-benzoquinol methylase
MTLYVWQHDLHGEPERLRMMSDLLDPSSRFHLERTGLTAGWRCLEIGAGDGSLSRWLADRVAPNGLAIATDIDPNLLAGLSGKNLQVGRLDVVKDEPPDAPFDLVLIRALLHHLPERRAVVSRLAHWVKPGGWLFVQEPDFYPTSTVEPASQREFWEKFVAWAATRGIDYYVGRKIAPWLQEEGMLEIEAEGHVGVYNGGSEYAHWWSIGIAEVADALRREANVSNAVLDEFFARYQDPQYWTATISFTAVTARRASS